jgi:hypothetical protein
MPTNAMMGPSTDQVVVPVIGLPVTTPIPWKKNSRPNKAMRTPSPKTTIPSTLRMASTVIAIRPAGAARRQGLANPAADNTFWPASPVTKSTNFFASAAFSDCLRTAIGYVLTAPDDSGNGTAVTLAPALIASVT